MKSTWLKSKVNMNIVLANNGDMLQNEHSNKAEQCQTFGICPSAAALPSTRHRRLLFSLSSTNSAKDNIFAPTRPQLLWDQGKLRPEVLPSSSLCQSPLRGASTPLAGQRGCPHPTGVTVTLKPTDSAVPAGLGGCRAEPTAPGQKGSVASDMQRFGAFPGPDSLIPAIIATAGKGSFLGSCKMTGIYREEPGGITAPRPGRTRHPLGVGWVHLSHTGSFAPLSCPKEREGGMEGLDVVALPISPSVSCPEAPSLHGAGTAVSLQGQSQRGGHSSRNGALGRAKGSSDNEGTRCFDPCALTGPVAPPQPLSHRS